MSVCAHVCESMCMGVSICVLFFQVRNGVISCLLHRSGHSCNADHLLAGLHLATFQSLTAGPQTVLTHSVSSRLGLSDAGVLVHGAEE